MDQVDLLAYIAQAAVYEVQFDSSFELSDSHRVQIISQEDFYGPLSSLRYLYNQSLQLVLSSCLCLR